MASKSRMGSRSGRLYINDSLVSGHADTITELLRYRDRSGNDPCYGFCSKKILLQVDAGAMLANTESSESDPARVRDSRFPIKQES